MSEQKWFLKPRFSLLPWTVLLNVARVFSYGAEKYAPDDWKEREPEYFIDKIYRHMNEVHRGIRLDQETKVHPVFHVAANVLMLCWVLTEQKRAMTPEDPLGAEAIERLRNPPNPLRCPTCGEYIVQGGAHACCRVKGAP